MGLLKRLLGLEKKHDYAEKLSLLFSSLGTEKGGENLAVIFNNMSEGGGENLGMFLAAASPQQIRELASWIEAATQSELEQAASYISTANAFQLVNLLTWLVDLRKRRVSGATERPTNPAAKPSAQTPQDPAVASQGASLREGDIGTDRYLSPPPLPGTADAGCRSNPGNLSNDKELRSAASESGMFRFSCP
jgi:hypothetical protein